MIADQAVAVADVSAFVRTVSDISDIFMTKGNQMLHGKLGGFLAVAYDFVYIEIHWISPDSYDIIV